MLIENAVLVCAGRRYRLYWRNGCLWVNPWDLGFDPRKVYFHDGYVSFSRYGQRRTGTIRVKAGRA